MKYRIWSIEHNAWWKPEGDGYTPYADEAGIYDEAGAFQIVQMANMPGLNIPMEALVPVFEEES